MKEQRHSGLYEQRLARQYSTVVREWNGTPFHVDMIRNFPDFVGDEDLVEQLRPIDRLADQIEKQIGYRIVEMGKLIDTPEGAAPNWNTAFEYYWRNDSTNSLLPRKAGQILVFYMDDDNPRQWDSQGGPPQNAHVCCGTISYNKRAMGPWWHGKDPCCTGQFAANGRYGEAIVHEVFHILGFRHPDDEPSDRGVPCTKALCTDRGQKVLRSTTHPDVTSIHCAAFFQSRQHLQTARWSVIRGKKASVWGVTGCVV